jgi:hypothetical protein
VKALDGRLHAETMMQRVLFEKKNKEAEAVPGDQESKHK